MRRLGWLAAVLALLYLAFVVVLAAVSLVSGDITLLWTVVADRSGFMLDQIRPWPWLVALLVAVAVVQAWAYREVLRGRPAGQPATNDRRTRLLRIALYAMVAYCLVLLLPIPYVWWLSLIGDAIQLAVVWLFYLVLRGRWLRVLVLVAGMLNLAHGMVYTFGFGLDVNLLSRLPSWFWVLDLVWPAWMITLLAAQARDPRWSRRTVRVGVAAVVMSFPGSGSGMSIVSFGGGGVPWELLFPSLLSAVSVFGTVWWARSAHDLGTLLPPEPRVRAVRARARWWPLPAVAIVLPLVPAAVNLAQGVPFWLGPKSLMWSAAYKAGGETLNLFWYVLDLLVGVGVPALLILYAVLRRTHRALRTTMLSLFLLAGAGAVSSFVEPGSELLGELAFYPDALYLRSGTSEPFDSSEFLTVGISPLWYTLALAASGLVLLGLYAAPPAHRIRRHVLLAGLASAVLLCLLPAADQARGPVTAGKGCEPPEPWEVQLGERQPMELTGEQKFVCALRVEVGGGLRTFADSTPDQIVLAYGRRMCGVHTRNDPGELARLKVDRAYLTAPLADICPSAAAVLRAERAEQDQELAAMQAESQAMCDATPRHRPRIKPAKAIRIKEPQWTDYGVLATYEGGEEETDPDMDPRNGVVSSASGILAVMTHPDFDLCVTLETYTRRPPVETKGWDTVAEVGYDSPTGKIVLYDGLSGTELPNLALDGRKGHYRIRVHHAWFDWKGDEAAGQRLLIMAYPGPGDKEVVYRKKTRTDR